MRFHSFHGSISLCYPDAPRTNWFSDTRMMTMIILVVPFNHFIIVAYVIYLMPLGRNIDDISKKTLPLDLLCFIFSMMTHHFPRQQVDDYTLIRSVNSRRVFYLILWRPCKRYIISPWPHRYEVCDALFRRQDARSLRDAAITRHSGSSRRVYCWAGR